MQDYLMLQRNLLYTAGTRARKLCGLTGSRRALGVSVLRNQFKSILDRKQPFQKSAP
jgi:ATP-dependent exoDNAse (exonuclease V) alpha subunit